MYRWIAKLSDGQEAIEHSEKWRVLPGQRNPWVRLVKYAEDHKLHIEELSVEVDGRRTNLPKAADRYSVQYSTEIDLIDQQKRHFVDLTTHYDQFEIHYVFEIEGKKESWIQVTQGYEPLCPSPYKNVTTQPLN
jgi:hypothetical protein